MLSRCAIADRDKHVVDITEIALVSEPAST